MTLIRVAAAWIRQALDDEFAEQSFEDAIADDEARGRLLFESLEASDLGWLTPSEWQWFGRWRQLRGGSLDTLLLNHLETEARSRAARFKLRALVMNEPTTNERANTDLDRDARPHRGDPDDVGLTFLDAHAVRTMDIGVDAALELLRDAMQVATPAARYTVRVMIRGRSDASDLVRRNLRSFFDDRGVDQEVVGRWLRDVDDR